jgi:hypothetical protein
MITNIERNEQADIQAFYPLLFYFQASSSTPGKSRAILFQ